MPPKLSTIDWSTLSHAFGPAVDVPDWLHGTSAGDAGARAWLLRCLYLEGTCFPATSAAVPGIIGIIADPSVPDRTTLLSALAEWSGAGAGDGLDGLESTPDLDEVSPFGTESQRTREAVAAGVPVFTRIASDATELEAIRAAALHLIAGLGESTGELPVLEAGLTADQPITVRASALMGLGKRRMLEHLDSATRSELLRCDNAVLRAATAIAEAWQEGRGITNRIWNVLVGTACSDTRPLVEGWGDLRLCAGARIFERRSEDRSRSEAALAKALEAAVERLPCKDVDTSLSREEPYDEPAGLDHVVASVFAGAVCHLAFERFVPKAEVATQTELSPSQRRLLELCGRANLPVPVEAIPYSGAKLLRLAVGDGPLEAVLPVGPRSAPTWLWFQRMANEEASAGSVRQALGSERTPDELIALLGDLWSGAYGEPGMVRADGHPTLDADAEAVVLDLLKPFGAELEKELAGRAGSLLADPDLGNIWEARAIVRAAAGPKGLPTIPRYDPKRLTSAWERLFASALAAGVEDRIVEALPKDQRSVLIGQLGPIGSRYWNWVDTFVASQAAVEALVNASGPALHAFSTHRARRFFAQLDPAVAPRLRAAIPVTSEPKRSLLKTALFDLTDPTPYRVHIQRDDDSLTVHRQNPDGTATTHKLPSRPTLREVQTTLSEIPDAEDAILRLEVTAPEREIPMLVRRWKHAAQGKVFECHHDSEDLIL